MSSVIAGRLIQTGTNDLTVGSSSGEMVHFFKISNMSQLQKWLKIYDLTEVVSIPDLSSEVYAYGDIVIEVFLVL